MLRRLLAALHRDLADQIPHRQYRPNELSREAVRAERLRREARLTESARRPAAAPEYEQAKQKQPAADPAPQARAAPLTASLRSRSELRRALLLKEILAPPVAVRSPRDEIPDQ